MNNDLISREALKEVFNGYHSGIGSQPKFTLGACLQLIDNAPTVEYPFYQEAYQSGYEEGKNGRTQDNLADEVWKLYEKHHSHLATHVLEFGYELKELLGKYQKGGAE